MLKIGLTGGYASGKSFVASELARLGCYVIHADQLGHQTLEPTGEAYAPAVELFGPAILTAEGLIDRKKLGALVFASPELLKKLNRIVHPAVFRLEEQALSRWQAEHPHGIAVIEAAILIETGRYRLFDRLILAACSLETQIARAMHRDHVTREQALARISHQLPLEDKKQYAHYIINTEGTKEQTAQQVKTVFEDLQQLAHA